MSLINKRLIYDSVIILIISGVLFTFVNFLFVYYSPSIIKVLPSSVARSILPCYRTLFHHDRESLNQSNFIFGDSYSEGSGDEFLESDPAYGIFNKLSNAKTSELIFGRSGYGNIGTVFEFSQCFPLLSKYTSLPVETIAEYDVTFVFYEGNDLNNNLLEKKQEANHLKYKIRFFLPLFEYVYQESRLAIVSMIKKIRQPLVSSKNQREAVFPVTSSGIEIPVYPQSAANELSEKELQESISLLFTSLDSIKETLPLARRYSFIYLPSVASSYNILGPLRVQSYKLGEYFESSKEFNVSRNRYLRKMIGNRVIALGWTFCDVTDKILAVTEEGTALHGPRDWKHFNKLGYEIVAQSYEGCISASVDQ